MSTTKNVEMIQDVSGQTAFDLSPHYEREELNFLLRLTAITTTNPYVFRTPLFSALRVFRFSECLALCLIVLLLGTSAAFSADILPATESGDKPAVDKLSLESVDARLAALRGEIELSDEESRSKALKPIETLLLRQRELLTEPSAPEVAQVPAVSTTGIYALNQLLEQQFNASESSKQLDERLETQRGLLSAGKDKLAQVEKAKRSVKSDAGDSAELAAADLVARTAREQVNVLTLELRRTKDEFDQLKLIDGRFDTLIEKQVKEIVAAPIGSVDLAFMITDEVGYRRTIEAITREIARESLKLEAMKRQYKASTSPELLAATDAQQVIVETLRDRVAMLEQRIERLPAEKQTWERWHAALHPSTPKKTIREWVAGNKEYQSELEKHAVRTKSKLVDVRRRLTTLSSVEGADKQTTRISALELLATALDKNLIETKGLQRTASRAEQQFDRRTFKLDPSEWLAKAVESVARFWNYEVTTVQDEPIRVSSIFIALFLAGIGLMVSRRLSSLIGRGAARHFKGDSGVATAIESLSFYFLLVTFILLALRSINFPLTAFTFLGGALAIGIGFGSQNVMNNFISGLILLLERPVRVQDVVEIDSQHGTIIKIGARSTHIQATDGRNIIVPNSFFLENNVINWTLSHDLIRAKVSVGIAYGSDTQKCRELLQKAIDGNSLILQDPLPVIVFSDFGDNALAFDCYFWVHARSPMEIRKISSRLRYDIDKAFAANDLVIAFPQRDVHLDTLTPLEVRVLPS